MGTRHLTCVVKDGSYKVAQYGQWDGYPSGQGVTVLDFLTNKMDRKLFESKVDALSWITEEEHHAQWNECGAKDEEWVSIDVAKVHTEMYPENSRDTGADILSLIQDSDRQIKLQNNMEFAKDSLFCEWAYVIDFDKNTLEVYSGFNKKPVKDGERFSNLEAEGEYYPVTLAQSFDLNNLPSVIEFETLLEPEDDDEE